MDFILPEYEPFYTKVIFYRIPKNASTSIYDHIGSNNLIHSDIENIKDKVDQRIYLNTFEPSHLKPDELKDIVPKESLMNFFSFCVVRNPWDRAVSMYLHAIDNNFKKTYNVKEEVTFDFFCSYCKERKDDPYFIGSHKQTEWTIGKYPPKTILRFESIKEDFSEMIQHNKIVTLNPVIPHKIKTKHAH